ncbi:MAG: S1 RNA-binding domain-containing protein, partial [Planctomycetota bacterium]
MSKSELLKQFSISSEALDSQFQDALGAVDSSTLDSIFREAVHDFEVDSILQGTVVSVTKDSVIVDVGYKSEGVVPLNQFESTSQISEGDRIDVLLEAVEDEDGTILLSKRKADRIKGWEKVISTYHEGDLVRGRVTRKIKGGLLLEIGVPVFLPASQISIRRVGDVSEYIGKELECKIIKIDEPRMNIVVSRRLLLEEQREEEKNKLLEEIEVNQVRNGVVKNITDFGAFVDLGGIDGLLHITDMSWGRITH